jgi:hypothetical protein
MANITQRVPGRPALFDDSETEMIQGWLVPLASKTPRDPILVRALPIASGWRGWEVGCDVTKPATVFSSVLWAWATPEQTSEFNEKYGFGSESGAPSV